MDGDGRPDIITGGWWYKNPSKPEGTWVRHPFGSPLNNAVALFDFDNDGRLDVLGMDWRGLGAENAI